MRINMYIDVNFVQNVNFKGGEFNSPPLPSSISLTSSNVALYNSLMLFNGHIHRNPKRYRNPHELAQAIDIYVESVDGSRWTFIKKDGSEGVGYRVRPSVAGLCLHLGLSSKQKLLELALGNQHNRALIETFFLWVEDHMVSNMQRDGANVTAYTFLLQAMGYKKDQPSNPQLPESRSERSIPGQTSFEGQKSGKIFQVTFHDSPHSLPEDEVRKQLIEAGGGDSAIMSAIDDEAKMREGLMQTVEATSEPKVIGVES